MYGKIFAQMFDGSLRARGPWQALVTFQQFIVLSNKHGEVDMTPEAISSRTGIPMEIIKLGIEELEKPDPDSRTPTEGGKRIVRLSCTRSWGWRIVNYDHYNKLRSEEERREYFRTYRQKERATKHQETLTPVQPCSSVFTSVQDVTSVDVDVKTKPCADPPGPHRSLFPSKTTLEVEAVARVWDYYIQKLGKNPKVLELTDVRKRRGLARLRECTKKTGGDLPKAERLMCLAVDALAASPHHNGENDRKLKYQSWEDNLFRNQEQLEKWLERI